MDRTKNYLRMEMLFLLFFPLCAASNSKFIFRPRGSEYQAVNPKPGGCNFGYLHYDIGDSWHPDITPFGVMFCVICTCGKTSNTSAKGKVTCRKIRHRCPTTSCARPKVEKGHCCPSCPDEFISLLTTPAASVSRQNGAGRAHFTLVRNTLHISIRYEGSRKLRMASFTDSNGLLLKEMNIQKRSINGSQVCLVWNQLNNKQIESLKQGRVSLALKLRRQQNAVGLTGDIITYKSYSQESFEALLSSDDETNNALASFNLAKSGKLLRIYLLYNGSHTIGSETQVTIKLTRIPTNNRDARVVKVIPSSQVKRQNSNLKTAWQNPPDHALKWMSRGYLNITMILNTGDQTTKLAGQIRIKKTCNTIVAQLSGRDAPRPTMTGASGYASFEFVKNGQIRYKISLSGMVNPVAEINLQATNRKQKVKRLSRSVNFDEHGQVKLTGIWQRPSFAEICWLFSGNMFINVSTTANRKGEIYGQLKQFPYRGHHLSYHDPPVLLSGNEVVPRIQTGAAGQAWFSLDKSCALHYHLMLSGMDRGRKNLRTAELQGFADYGEVPQPYDEHVHFLRSFEGETISGSTRNLEPVFLSHLIRGLVYLQVSSEEVPQGELRSQVLLNEDSCSKRLSLTQQGEMRGSCHLGDKIYSNGEKWISEDDKCTSCICEDTEIVCSTLKCQRLNCTEAPIILPHLCCPVCPAIEEKVVIYYEKKNRPSLKGCYVKRDRKVYPAGAVWHPFVQPFGYMRCHACTCLEKTEDISCKPVKCPELRCKNPIKLRMTDCCMRCPDEDDSQADDGKKDKKGCTFSGSRFKHGQTWKPYYPLFGPSRCITCSCDNGKTNCKRDPCPKGQCRNSIMAAMTSCCVPCSES